MSFILFFIIRMIKRIRKRKSEEQAATGVVPERKNGAPWIYPMGFMDGMYGWSTSLLATDPVPLNDATLSIVSGRRDPHKYVKAPDGSPSLRASYTRGSIDPPRPSGSFSGLSIYATGPTDLSRGREITFAYSAFFQSGFNFNRGGVMPGLYGGTRDAVANTYSSDNHRNPACWSLRLVWRANGAGELCAYLPPKVQSQNPNYPIGRDSFTWKTGAWTHVALRVRLNDFGVPNSELEVFVDGISVIRSGGIMLRTESGDGVRGVLLQSFFGLGGHDSTWASPQDQACYFKDFTAAVNY